MVKANEKFISVSEYAKRKKVSRRAVYDALNSGRITAANTGKKPVKLNPIKADEEWRAFTQEEHAGIWKKGQKDVPSNPQPNKDDEFDETSEITKDNSFQHMQLAKAKRETWLAKTAELEFQQMAGELISVKETKSTWQQIITTAKTKILAVPSKARARLPHLTLDDIATLEELVRESLEDLANGTIE